MSRASASYLRSQRRAKHCRVTGFTNSTFPNSPFWGVWWSDDNKKWIPEKVAILVVDYQEYLGDQHQHLEAALRRLNRVILNRYEHFGRKQESTWIVAQSATRFA